jgi:Phasin protein
MLRNKFREHAVVGHSSQAFNQESEMAVQPLNEPKTPRTEAFFPIDLSEAQKQGASLFSRTSELVVDTSRSLLQIQSELFKLESDQANKNFESLKLSENPAAAISTFVEQWRRGAEHMLSNFRKSNDVALDFSTKLYAILSEGMQQASNISKSSLKSSDRQ